MRTIRNAPQIGRQRATGPAGACDLRSGKFDDDKLLEVLGLTGASPTEPLCPLEKFGTDVSVYGEEAIGKKFYTRSLNNG